MRNGRTKSHKAAAAILRSAISLVSSRRRLYFLVERDGRQRETKAVTPEEARQKLRELTTLVESLRRQALPP